MNGLVAIAIVYGVILLLFLIFSIVFIIAISWSHTGGGKRGKKHK